VSRQIAIGGSELGQPAGQQSKMASLLGGDADPVVEEVARQSLAGEPGDQVPSEVDGVELDMSQRMKEGDAARP
jgi:hypothetical protein